METLAVVFWLSLGLLFLASIVAIMRDGRDAFGNDGCADARVWR